MTPDTAPRRHWTLKAIVTYACAAAIILVGAWLLDDTGLDRGTQLLIGAWIIAAFAFVGAIRRDRSERDWWAEPVWNFLASAIVLVIGLVLTLQA